MSDFTIKPFAKAAQPSEYAPAVKALIEVGDGQALDIVVPTADTAKARRAFGTAARDAGYSAKTETVIDNKDDKDKLTGFSTITFTLGALRTRSVKPKDSATAEESAPELGLTENDEAAINTLDAG